MNRRLLMFWLCASGVAWFAAAVPTLSDEPPAAQARNPLLWADVPDPAVIRVGDTYYMSSTTMHMSPGLPIMKSRDLAHWELVGYAYETLADNDALALRNGKNAYGAGSWASSLRFHQGTYYATTFSSTTGRTHVFATRDIERGPWTARSFAPALHDHTLVFEEDGRAYMLHGGGDVWLTELEPDLSGVKPGGVNQVVIPKASLVAGANVGLPAEGSHALKVQGRYYHSMITWPRGGMRTQLVFRSDRLEGPYEGRVALQHAGIAQGGLIDTPAGDWYALLFQDHGAVGRMPYLVPVAWEDGWPTLGVDGTVPETLDIPVAATGPGGVTGIVASDEFARRPGDRPLPLAWQWNHNPDPRSWSLDARPGFLRLTTGRVDAELLAARNTLTQRSFGPVCSATIALDVTGLRDGDCAGLALLQKHYGFIGVRQTGADRAIVMVGAAGDRPEELARVPLSQPTLYLRAECDFRERRDRAYFGYSLDGATWTSLGQPLAMQYTLPHFIGYRFGLFNYATQASGGHVDVDYFRVAEELTLPSLP